MSAEVQMHWLMNKTISADADISLARMSVPVGVTSECHRHTHCSETLHLLTGKVQQRLGVKSFEMSPGDTCFIPVGEIHQTKNIGDVEAVMMVCYSSASRNYERID